MNRHEFITYVIGNVRNKEVHEAIYSELDDHLQQTISELKAAGLSEADAQQQAITQMGDANKLGKQLNKLHRPKIDWTLSLTLIVLFTLSFIPMYLMRGNVPGEYLGDPILKKAQAIGLSLLIITFTMFFDYRKLKRVSLIIYGLSSLILLFSLWYGETSPIGIVFLLVNLKLDLLMFIPLFCLGICGIISKKQISWMVLTLLYVIPVSLFVATDSNFNTLLFTIMFWLLIAFSKQSKKTKILFIFINGGAILSLFLYFAVSDPNFTEKSFAILDPIVISKASEENVRLIERMNELIKASGWFGHPIPKEGVISYLAYDFIFVAMVYFFGWGFSSIVILLFLILLIRIGFVIYKIQDEFGRLLCSGVVIIIAFTLGWNFLMIFGFMPFVSVSLPFFSYGTFPVVLCSFLIGLVLSVYRRNSIGMIKVT